MTLLSFSLLVCRHWWHLLVDPLFRFLNTPDHFDTPCHFNTPFILTLLTGRRAIESCLMARFYLPGSTVGVRTKAIITPRSELLSASRPKLTFFDTFSAHYLSDHSCATKSGTLFFRNAREWTSFRVHPSGDGRKIRVDGLKT